jgi:hypothetical protein
MDDRIFCDTFFPRVLVTAHAVVVHSSIGVSVAKSSPCCTSGIRDQTSLRWVERGVDLVIVEKDERKIEERLLQ